MFFSPKWNHDSIVLSKNIITESGFYCFKGVLKKLRNHDSVILWGCFLFNEIMILWEGQFWNKKGIDLYVGPIENGMGPIATLKLKPWFKPTTGMLYFGENLIRGFHFLYLLICFLQFQKDLNRQKYLSSRHFYYKIVILEKYLFQNRYSGIYFHISK